MTEQSYVRHERKAKAIDLLGGYCVKCGTTESIQFDHINRDRIDEEHKISILLLGKWDNVLKELRKCQLLCLKCHLFKSHEERGHTLGGAHGLPSTYTKYQCRCGLCTTAWSTYSRKRKRSTLAFNN